jgi:metallo-beta-lactamase family protein
MMTPIFLDSPMAIKATEIYKKYRRLFNKELTEHIANDDPFDFPGLRIIEHGDESMKIHNTPGAKVIIAGSGMMTGGRIVQHAFHYLKRSTTRLLIVGYQGEATLGRALADGATEVEIFKQMVPVYAHVRVVSSMSAHADEPKLLEWLGHIKGVRQVILVHGDDEPREMLKKKIMETGMHNIRLPQMYETHELTV